MSRPVSHSLVKALRAVPEFRLVDDDTLLALVGASVNLFWPGGSLVFDSGDAAEGLYVVLSGQVRIFSRTDGREQDVVVVDPGGFFGEHSLLLDTIHSKSAAAVEPSELMVVPREAFEELLASHPDLADELRSRLAARLAAEAKPE
jgi:CRP/FNR family transcriptional regulator